MDFSFYKKRFSSPWFAFILIGLSVLVIYSNIYKSPFVFDDLPSIVENKNIKDLSNFSSLSNLLKPRAIVDFTFALNYRVGKLNVFGYHLVNVLIHILNGFLVYFLAFAILQQRPEFSSASVPSKAEFPEFSIRTISLFSALIFVVHPIQTQAVTYTVQRYTSMAAMFYMASVLFYLKARIIQQRAKRLKRAEKEKDEKTDKLRFSSLYALSVFCGMLAFLSKQNTASLPLAILLLEYLLVDRTWQEWKKKLPWFAVSFALWTLFILYISGLFKAGFEGRELLGDVSGLLKETEAVSRWQYLCTQFNVVVIYLRLLLLPVQQNLDYLYPFKSGFFDAYTPFVFLLLVGLAALGAWHIKKRPVISLAIFWFLITLSVESSIIPIRDALFEHRLYLPMLGFGLFVSYQLSHYLSNKRLFALILLLAIVVSLGVATYQRNITWQDAITLWADVVSKSPYNHRAHNHLSHALDKQGRTEEAIDHYLQALRIKPDDVGAHNNLANDLDKQGRIEEAVGHYLQALRIKPDFEKAHNNLGNLLEKQGRTEEAIGHYLQALRIKPDFEEAHYNIGYALEKQGRIEEAVGHYLKALQTKPDYAEAHNNLGNALLKQGKDTEAMEHFNSALRLNPNLVQAHNSLGTLLVQTGKIDEAIVHFRKALQINPVFAETHVNLGGALLSLGRIDEAVVHFHKALAINPDMAEVHINLGVALANSGKVEEAVAHFRKALGIDPGNPEAQANLNKTLAILEEIDREIAYIQEQLALKPQDPMLNYNLGNLYRMKGQLDKAQDYYTKAVSLRSEFPEAIYELAKLHVGRGEYEKALSLYQKMLTFLPDNPAVYYNIACIFARWNKPGESVSWLQQAVARGLTDWEHIKTDKDLDNIRSSQQYKEFIKDHVR